MIFQIFHVEISIGNAGWDVNCWMTGWIDNYHDDDDKVDDVD